jgi:hypothetical protein
MSYWRFTFGQQPNEIQDFSSVERDILLQNPTNNQLVIHNIRGVEQEARIRIIDLTGKLIWQTQTQLERDVTRLDTGFLPSGLYAVIIETTNARYHFKWLNRLF